VIPPGAESDTKTIKLGSGQGYRQETWMLPLIQNKLHKGVNTTSKSGVVTLTGEVNF